MVLAGRRLLGLATIAAILLSTPSAVRAADDNNAFAIKGAGHHTCANFAKAYAERSPNYTLYGGWIEGFVTAFNQFQEKTYDVAPWQTTELMLGMMARYCQREPELRFLDAFSRFIREVYPQRLVELSKLQKITVRDRALYVYGEMVLRIEARLDALGHKPGEVDGRFEIATSRALESFQAAKNLPVNGMPDQRTLFELLLRPLNTGTGSAK